MPDAAVIEEAAGTDVPPAVTAALPEGIAILGSHPATRAKAPFDKNWLIYACSPCNSPFGFSEHSAPLPRVDAWFEVHLPVFDKTRPYPYLGWLSQGTPTVYMRDSLAMNMQFVSGEKLFPNAQAYPEKELKQLFGPFTFTSSIAFMLAKAIVDIEAGLAGRKIGLWGIMQASQTEYFRQRPGVQNLIWEATKRGIKVIAPKESMLFEPQPEDF